MEEAMMLFVKKRDELDRTIDGILHRQDAITKIGKKPDRKLNAAYETQAKTTAYVAHGEKQKNWKNLLLHSCVI